MEGVETTFVEDASHDDAGVLEYFATSYMPERHGQNFKTNSFLALRGL